MSQVPRTRRRGTAPQRAASGPNPADSSALSGLLFPIAALC